MDWEDGLMRKIYSLVFFGQPFQLHFKKLAHQANSPKVNEPMLYFYILSPFIFTKRAEQSKFIASTGKTFLTILHVLQ